ncbi:MAG TPA: pepsin/retropepsin-like aspartic protease family protein [Pyrinomonadaceae bacterium]|nr:pepsin/retropepsin-like aspartic protease family protein [Pyrinomonadaceae bacterium]
MLRSLVLSLFVLAILSFQMGRSSASWQEVLRYQQKELFPIRIGKYGFPLVPVSVNGNALNFVWDTGNTGNPLINPELAKRLSLTVSGEDKYYDTSGALLGTHQRFALGQLNLLGKTWTNQQANEFWQTDLDGTIGPHFVLSGRFTLDYHNRVIAVSDSPLPKLKVSGDVLPMFPASRYPQMIVIEGTVNGRKALIQIDTGKSRTCVDTLLVTALGLPPANNGYEIREVKIGRYSFSVSSAKEINFNDISEGLPQPIMLGIGSDIVSQLVLSVDYSQHIVLIGK